MLSAVLAGDIGDTAPVVYCSYKNTFTSYDVSTIQTRQTNSSQIGFSENGSTGSRGGGGVKGSVA